MKLVDILARELKVWPEGWVVCSQDSDSYIAGYSDASLMRFSNGVWVGMDNFISGDWVLSKHDRGLSSDYPTAIVTRAEWQAAVDALNAPKVVEWEQGDIPPIGEPCEAYVLAETEKQGNPMSQWIHGKFIGRALADNGGIALLVECDDGFTHVINAFSYVRPPRTPEQVAAEEREKTAEALYMSVMDHKTQYWPTLQEHRKEHYRGLVDAGWQKVAK